MRIAKVLEIQGLKVNRKRVSRLMRLMGLCPKGTNYKYKKYNQQNKHEEHPKSGLIVHTDQGSQFTSGNFQMLLKSKKAIHSESRKGNYYDNALMESFYRTIKRELIRDAHYETPKETQKEVFKYIELYYNTKRMHSSLGYISPTQFEEQNSHNYLNFVSTKA